MTTMDANMKKMLQTQLDPMGALTPRIANLTIAYSSPEILSDVLLYPMTDFFHDPQAGIGFESWFKQYQNMFAVDLADEDDKSNVRLFQGKLGLLYPIWW